MSSKNRKPLDLTNPNDPSPGQCYAPVENGKPNKKKKKHYTTGTEYPDGWVQVPCDSTCRS